MQNTRKAVARLVTGKACLVAIGNRLRGDDGAGPALVSRLRDQVDFPLFDAGVAVENHLEQIAAEHPEAICFVDATDFGGRSGEARLLPPSELIGRPSTHAPSLAIAAEYLVNRTGCEVWLLAIQPQSTGLGDDLSAPVKRCIEQLAADIAGTQRLIEESRAENSDAET